MSAVAKQDFWWPVNVDDEIYLAVVLNHRGRSRSLHEYLFILL